MEVTMITIGNIKESYNINTYYDREDIFYILYFLQDNNLIDIIDEVKLSNKLDDILDQWEEIDG